MDRRDPVDSLAGIGPARARDLAELGIENVGEFLRFERRAQKDPEYIALTGR